MFRYLQTCFSVYSYDTVAFILPKIFLGGPFIYSGMVVALSLPMPPLCGGREEGEGEQGQWCCCYLLLILGPHSAYLVSSASVFFLLIQTACYLTSFAGHLFYNTITILTVASLGMFPCHCSMYLYMPPWYMSLPYDTVVTVQAEKPLLSLLSSYPLCSSNPNQSSDLNSHLLSTACTPA